MTDAEPRFRIIAGSPTAAELAAVTAVIDRALEELANDDAARADDVRSGWDLAQRPIRTPIVRGVTTWRGFSG